MNAQTETAGGIADRGNNRPTRPFYWSVRRELWDNPSIYVAPLVAAGVVLLGCLVTAYRLPQLRRTALLLEDMRQRAAIEAPYDIAAVMIMFTAFIVAVFYTLDALHGERRDRSILFWKSMPVSDRTTVLSKALVPLVIIPLLTFVIVELTQLMMLLITSVALAPSGLAGTTWRLLPIFRLSVILFYGLITSALWAAPLYGWMLLVGAYARRATFLWAVLPWLAVCAIEKIVFGTGYLARIVAQRVTGNFEEAFVVMRYPKDAHVPIVDRLTQLDPVKFLSSPGLWIGLVIAAAFVIGAIQLRRYRGPL
ncbi:MAG: ABC transporter permease [Chthoniobacterales bacterium]